MAKPRPVPKEGPQMVRVRALKENVLKLQIGHKRGSKFNRDGVAEWPMDQFTQRRIRDGDVMLVTESVTEEERKPSPRPTHRARA